MGLKIYVDYLSQPCRALYLFLKINNIPYEEEKVSLAAGEQKKESFLKMNPMHAVPVINDDGFILTESTAILRYLAAKHNVPSHWDPVDLKKRARVEEFLAWEPSGLRGKCVAVFVAQVITPFFTKKPADKKEVEEKSKACEEALNQIEAYFLKDTDYLAGDEMSICDIKAVCECMQPMSIGYDLFKGRPKFKAWFDRVKQKFQPHFDEITAAILKFGASYKLDDTASSSL